MKIIVSNEQRISGSDTNFTVSLQIGSDFTNKEYNVYVQQVYVSGVESNDNDFLILKSDSLNSNTSFSTDTELRNTVCVVEKKVDAVVDTSGAKYLYQKTSSLPDFTINNLSTLLRFQVQGIEEFFESTYVEDNLIIIVLFLQEI